MLLISLLMSLAFAEDKRVVAVVSGDIITNIVVRKADDFLRPNEVDVSGKNANIGDAIRNGLIIKAQKHEPKLDQKELLKKKIADGNASDAEIREAVKLLLEGK